MSTRSTGLLLLSWCIGCATAAEPHGASPPPDAPSGHPAAPDAAIRLPDGATGACATPYSGVLATWTFAAEAGTQASTAAGTMAPGVTAGAIRRATALTAAAGTSSINSSNWTTSAQPDTAKYYTVSITPPSGCALSLTSASIDLKASATGPATAALATSIDGFAQTATASTTAPSTPTLSVTGASGAVELRIYGFAATGTTGTMRVQSSFTVTGTLE